MDSVNAGPVERCLDWKGDPVNVGRARVYQGTYGDRFWFVVTPASWPDVRAFRSLPEAMDYAGRLAAVAVLFPELIGGVA